MKALKIPLIISALALVICAVSALYASGVNMTDSDGRPDWDSFDRSIWITVLVTVPTFCIFLAAAITVLVRFFQKK